MQQDRVSGERTQAGGAVHQTIVSGGGPQFPVYPKRGKASIVIWLNTEDGDDPPNPWSDLSWGGDEIQDFADALIDYFNNNTVPEPAHGDLVAGKDTDDNIVILRVTEPVDSVDDGASREQIKAPEAFKEE